MQKPKMQSINPCQAKAEMLMELFPECVTESRDAHGRTTRCIDLARLQLELGQASASDELEKYTLNWPGKRQAALLANTPSNKTLRPSQQAQDCLGFNTTQNLMIEGDNLDALKIVQEAYLGKIQFIYIDPPYNTGKDFIYNDKFTRDMKSYLQVSGATDDLGNRMNSNTQAQGRFHSDWLSMLYPRLKLAKSLLRPDGIILISIDDHEHANLRKICDEIFGYSALVGVFAWRARTAKADVPFGVSNDVEWIVAYGMPKFQAGRPGERKYHTSADHKDRWRLQDLTKNTTKAERPNSYFTLVNPKNGDAYPAGENRTWSITAETFPEYYHKGKIVFPGDYPFLNIKRPAFRVFESEDQDKALKKYGSTDVRMSLSTHLPESLVGRTEHGTKEIIELFGAPVFSYPKPSSLIQYFLETCSQQDAIVLDFFAGSGTTAQAVLQQNAKDGGNRRFILVQLPEPLARSTAVQRVAADFCMAADLPLNICEITKERIRRVGQRLLAQPQHADWNQDTGFRVLKLDSSNLAEVYYTPAATLQEQLDLCVNNIKPERTPADLLFQVMLDWGLDPGLAIDQRQLVGLEVFFVAHTALAACFDDQGRVDQELARALALQRPERVVFRDAGFKDSAAKILVEQIFKTLSPSTALKSL